MHSALHTSVLGKQFSSYGLTSNHKLVSRARNGVSTDLFYQLAVLIKMPEKNLAQLIQLSTRTISNYKESKRMLNPVEGEHLLKLIALYELGETIFGNVDEFNYWLKKPFWNQQESPIDWLVTPGGIDLVIDEITKMAYGDAV